MKPCIRYAFHCFHCNSPNDTAIAYIRVCLLMFYVNSIQLLYKLNTENESLPGQSFTIAVVILT